MARDEMLADDGIIKDNVQNLQSLSFLDEDTSKKFNIEQMYRKNINLILQIDTCIPISVIIRKKNLPTMENMIIISLSRSNNVPLTSVKSARGLLASRATN